MRTLLTTQPFHIGISQAVLDDLRARLTRTRRARVLRKGGWEAGSDPGYFDELLRYWRDEYDWRAQEHALNQLSHFIARIDDASVHYVHETGLGANPTPLLLLHGWPDSFLRYRGAIPHLTGVHEQHEPRFDVVVPSLPGFGFTGLIPPASRGSQHPYRGAAAASAHDRSAGLRGIHGGRRRWWQRHRAEHGDAVSGFHHRRASHRYRLVWKL